MHGMMVGKMGKMEIDVPADQVEETKEHFNEMGMKDVEIHGVDLNKAFVPTDKYNPDNLEEAEEHIHKRFSC